MSGPAIKLRGNTEFFSLLIKGVEMGLEIGKLFGTHSENPLELDYFPVLTSYIPTTPCPSSLLGIGKDHHCGNGTGQFLYLIVLCCWLDFELIKKWINCHHRQSFLVRNNFLYKKNQKYQLSQYHAGCCRTNKKTFFCTRFMFGLHYRSSPAPCFFNQFFLSR